MGEEILLMAAVIRLQHDLHGRLPKVVGGEEEAVTVVE